MRVLFVCSANKDRSRTADDHFSKKYPKMEFKSGGTNHKICHKEGTTPLTEDMVNWADLVLVMENKHQQLILESAVGNYTEKIKVLHIKDIYKYGQSELIQLLEETAGRYIRNTNKP